MKSTVQGGLCWVAGMGLLVIAGVPGEMFEWAPAGPLTLLGLAAAFSLASSGTLSPLTVVTVGVTTALLLRAPGPGPFVVALTLLHLPRALAAGSRSGAAMLVFVGGAAAAVAAWLAAGTSSPLVLGCACLLLPAPLFIEVDSPERLRLRRAVRGQTGRLRWTLLRAMVLRRRLPLTMQAVSLSARRRLLEAFNQVDDLAAVLATSGATGRKATEIRLTKRIRHLSHIDRQARHALALQETLEDSVLDGLKAEHEALRDSTRALRELHGDPTMQEGEAQAAQQV